MRKIIQIEINIQDWDDDSIGELIQLLSDYMDSKYSSNLIDPKGEATILKNYNSKHKFMQLLSSESKGVHTVVGFNAPYQKARDTF